MRRKFPGLRKFALILANVMLIGIAMQTAINLEASGGALADRQYYDSMLPGMLIFSITLLQLYGLFSVTRKKFSEVIAGLALVSFNQYIVVMSLRVLLPNFYYSQSILLISVSLQFLFLGVWYALFWYADQSSMKARSALVVGKGEECERIIRRLQTQAHLQDYVRYVCSDSETGSWRTVAENVDLIIVGSGLAFETKAEIVQYCHTHGKQIFVISDFYELFCNGFDLDKIDDIPVFRPRYLDMTFEQQVIKRIFDIAVSVCVMLFLWPVFLLIALAIKLDSPGPVFYTQIRSGRKEKEFLIYKFRTMRQDAESLSGPVLATENDHRITRVGSFLRASRLDELPQFINVLLGDMSVVGPRPERPFFVEQFKVEVPEYVYRLNVKPGITGMAQVYGKYDTTVHDKLMYDLIYIQQYNLVFDLMIMMMTVKVLLSKGSAAGVNVAKNRADLSQYRVLRTPRAKSGRSVNL